MPDSPTTSPLEPDAPIQPIPPGIPLARPLPPPLYARPVDPMLLYSATPKQSWADIGLVILLLVGFETGVGTIIMILFGPLGETSAPKLDPAAASPLRDFVIPMLGLRALATAVVVYLIAHRRRQPRESVGVSTRALPINVMIGLLAPIAAYCFIGLVMLTMMALWPDTIQKMTENSERLMAIIPPLNPMLFIPLAMLIGIYEEVLFRGFLLTRLRRGTGSWTIAVVISPALFTALHAGEQTLPALVMVTILSLMFSGLTIWRRTIVPAIIAHTLWDLSQFLLMYFSAGDQWH